MIRRLIQALLTLLVILAAALMTAIFIFWHPTPLEHQQATFSQGVRFSGGVVPAHLRGSRVVNVGRLEALAG